MTKKIGQKCGEKEKNGSGGNLNEKRTIRCLFAADKYTA